MMRIIDLKNRVISGNTEIQLLAVMRHDYYETSNRQTIFQTSIN